jgi:integrase
MSKSLVDAPLTTAAARKRLVAGLHWRGLDPDTHLGYRKGARAGRWLVRWRNGVGYLQATLATADDVLTADGRTTMTFDQASRAARDHVERARADAAAVADGPTQTVRMATECYAETVEARQIAAGRLVSKDARSRFKNHLWADDLADRTLYSLKASDLRKWRESARAKCASASTLQRVVNDLRAALNEAGRIHQRKLPDRFPVEVREGFAVATHERAMVAIRPNVILPDADVRRLIIAAREIDAERGWGGDLARIVVALAATGARFSQIARCIGADLQLDTRRLMVPVSRKGRGRKAASHTAVAIGDDVITELRPAIAGRRGHELLFQRWGYRRAGGLKWERHERRGWLPAELSQPFAEIVQRAELPGDVTAYALRHSSIVRALRVGLPVRLVAALHDTSSEMIEAHYSAHIVDAMTDAARLAVVPLADTARVSSLRSA